MFIERAVIKYRFLNVFTAERRDQPVNPDSSISDLRAALGQAILFYTCSAIDGAMRGLLGCWSF
jgi:hypothetical protein